MRLTEKDDLGHWFLKGLEWGQLREGKVITKAVAQKLYGALCKLMRRYKWMLPVKQSNLTNVDWIHPKAKYHCFFKNTSLCEKYWQDQDFFTTDIDTEEIEKNPGLACKKCYQLWKNLKLK